MCAVQSIKRDSSQWSLGRNDCIPSEVSRCFTGASTGTKNTLSLQRSGESVVIPVCGCCFLELLQISQASHQHLSCSQTAMAVDSGSAQRGVKRHASSSAERPAYHSPVENSASETMSVEKHSRFCNASYNAGKGTDSSKNCSLCNALKDIDSFDTLGEFFEQLSTYHGTSTQKTATQR